MQESKASLLIGQFEVYIGSNTESTAKVEEKIQKALKKIVTTNAAKKFLKTKRGKDFFDLYQNVLKGEAKIALTYTPVLSEKAITHGVQMIANS